MLPAASVRGSGDDVDVEILHPRLRVEALPAWCRALSTLLRVTSGGGDPVLAAGALLEVDDGLPWAATVTASRDARAAGPRRRLLVTGAGGGAGLAWAHVGSALVAAPDVADVLARLAEPPDLDLDVLARMCALDPDPRRTVWRGVGLLGRGMVLDTDSTGRVAGRRAWFVLPAQPRRPRRADVPGELARLRHELDAATASLLAGDDGPLGMLCSSGLDSALVATSLAPLLRATGRRAEAWTAVPAAGAALPSLPGWLLDELDGARRIAAGTGGLDVVPVPDDARAPWIDDIDDLVRLGWLPVPNPGNLTWLRPVGDLARESQVGTLLTGAGGNLLLSASRPDIGAALLQRGQIAAARRAVHARRAGRGLGAAAAVRAVLLGPTARSLGLRSPSRPDAAAPAFVVAHLRHPATGATATPAAARHTLLAAARATYPHELLHSGVGPGVVAADPTMHPRLLMALASLPDEGWAVTDPSRGVARALLAGRVDDAVRLAATRGLQSAGQWGWTFPRRDAYGDVVATAAGHPELVARFDLAAMRGFIERWPGADAPPDVATLQAFDRTAAALAFALRAPTLAESLGSPGG